MTLPGKRIQSKKRRGTRQKLEWIEEKDKAKKTVKEKPETEEENWEFSSPWQPVLLKQRLKRILFYTREFNDGHFKPGRGEAGRMPYWASGAYFRVGYGSLHTLPPSTHPTPVLSTSWTDRGEHAGCPSFHCGCTQPRSVWQNGIPLDAGDQ